MVDVSGIPNLGFGGGPIFAGGYSPNVNYGAQNNANLAYVNNANQASLNANNLYGPGGFGAATSYYSGLGAAYGRATGYYGDTSGLPPGSAPSPGGGLTNYQDPGAYADYNSLNSAQQAYYDAHVARYGYAPDANNSALLGLASPGPAGPFQSATGNVGQSPGMAPGFGGFNNPVNNNGIDFGSLSPGGQAYYNAHVARYGYAPEANNPGLHPEGASASAEASGGFAGPGFGGIGAGSSGQVTGGGSGGTGLFESLGPGGQAYYQAHLARYGYAPDANNPNLHPAGDGPPTSGPGSGIEAINQAAGIDPNTGWQYGVPRAGTPTDPGEGGALNFFTLNAQQQAYDLAHYAKYQTLAGANNSALRAMGLGGPQSPDVQALASQRASFADRLSNNPDTALDWATRLYLESQGNSQTRQAIAEAMMNRQVSTGEDVLNNTGYFPINKPAYNDQYTAARNMLQNNEALRSQIYGELGNAIGGSNYSNYATDWASGGTAADEATWATPTWTSPDNEGFYRKDIYSPSTGQIQAGQGVANANLLWYNSLHGAPPL